jgi:hypothetical protein
MTTKTKKKEVIQTNKSGAEKPVSLWGASFTAVLDALLKTRPMPKGGKNGRSKKTTKSTN